MPERDNDKLESFFKKVSGRPDVSFNEEDWKKLEARLDAKEARSSIVRRNTRRIAGASVIAVLLIGGLYWLSQPNMEPTSLSAVESTKGTIEASKDSESDKLEPDTKEGMIDITSSGNVNRTEAEVASKSPNTNSPVANEKAPVEIMEKISASTSSDGQRPTGVVSGLEADRQLQEFPVESLLPVTVPTIVDDIESNNSKDITSSPAIADKIKQKANTADSVVREENDVKVIDAYGSGLTEHPASPRLSLLLSIAPDFSTVSFDYYTDPGQAFGLMLHYHLKRSWSFSAGVVKSHKKYVGDGEDYAPPKGYWRNNTNGIIPETVDGSCNVLEIPIMVQYTIANNGKNKFLVGAGASSYVMLNEKYVYNFEQPNPGAKQGWSSKNSSTQFFNVINVTAAYERRLATRFWVGIEPYLKIPVEGIGWSNLNLYSAGASLTLRYIILNQRNPSTVVRNQGPG